MQPIFDTHDLEAWFYTDDEKTWLTQQALNAGCYHGHEWNYNFQSNMARGDHKWISGEFDKHDGTVIVCGAGPSLSNLPQLKIENPEATVFVCDRAIDRVFQANVPIDWIVSRDSQSVVADFFKEQPCEAKVALSLFSHNDVYESVAYTNEVYWYGPIAPWAGMFQAYQIKFGSEHATTLESATVLGSMVDIVTRMGFSKVILIGGDLCFPQGSMEALDKKLSTRETSGFLTCDAFIYQAEGLRLLKSIYPDMEYIDASGGLLRNVWQSYEWRGN